MNDERDPILAEIFERSDESHIDESFTASVMKKVRQRRLALFALAGLLAAILLAIATANSLALQQIVFPITELLATELITIDDSTVAWFAAPINNVATVIIVLGKLLRVMWLRARRSNYAI